MYKNCIIIENTDSKNAVINSICFAEKCSVSWDDAKEYLNTFVGKNINANAAQELPEMIKIATDKHFREITV